ncbi:SOS response-associated peptidase [Colwellia sp. MT41]|uniref:SOS response-associated peptidase n=1 Tax=Colwellia sp. MT41 TaxID=58049 RepID=UPI001E58AE2A|nr:SOS response-associated peptidase [Colwellia sp. MT41]
MPDPISKKADCTMCGRMKIESKHSKIISDFFGCKFSVPANNNLSPGQNVATLISNDANKGENHDSNEQISYQQLDANWGMQPSWSKRLLINAQSETVLTKNTFKVAIKTHRCLIPCSGWYEWRTEGGKKQKYLFSHVNEEPFLMAGIWYLNNSENQSNSQGDKQGNSPEAKRQLLTLTTAPNAKCADYHQRMPVIILPQYRDFWFQAPAEQLVPLFQAIDENYIKVTKA